MKRLFVPLLLSVGSLWLVAAGGDGWLTQHWSDPAATKGDPPHGWSQLTQDLHPEACAQCHQAQFGAWQGSRHARAFSPGMVGQFAHMATGDANDCLACHAPLDEQKLANNRERRDALTGLVAHAPLLDASVPPKYSPNRLHKHPLNRSGVSCAVCHVRGWHRFGPPPKGSRMLGQINTGVHGGFIARKEYTKSQFCAKCHQFPQDYAINGKPLENTLTEWRASRFAALGVACQGCHMPGRRHLFRGIHDRKMVRSGLGIALVAEPGGAALTLTSQHIGHAFPTYVTPQVTVEAEALDRKGMVVRGWSWLIGRKVGYADGGWQEQRDSRLMPGEHRSFRALGAPASARVIRFRIRVEPDHFYKGVYRALLADAKGDARILLARALADAGSNDYELMGWKEIHLQ
ncbi:MAG: multiheme c-type cytochrome [Mariprofundales bacterium]|nr:multiheme c-type cytochrome [Mariprofundales bacterium]